MIYLAYTREDALFAVQITEDLASLGIDLWLDITEIGAGVDWEAAQSAAIEAAEGLIMVVSPEALQREHMRHEISRAFDRGKDVYLAVARRSPWQDWMHGLPVADFTEQYEAGLDTLVLHLMGDDQHAVNEEETDLAEQFLREALQSQQQATPESTAEQQKSRQSILSRLFRRS